MRQVFYSTWIFIFIIFLCTPALSDAQSDKPGRPVPDSADASDSIQIFVRPTDKKIMVDGVLDEEAWKDADPYEDYFFQLQPLDREPSSEKTRVMVLQNQGMLYFGIQCYDSEPEKIFASSMRRDNNYGSGEVIELLLDTFQDNRNCYAFDTNPLGGKGDAIISDQGNHVNKQWECVIDMDGSRNEEGWAAEFAVPFKSLKYRQGECVDWNINITREIKHRQEETYLVPIPRAWGHMAKFRGELFARLRDIRPPKQKFHFEVHPYVIAGRTNMYETPVQRNREFNAGMDFKYDFTPQLALDLTYRTDFAQTEAEEEIVNVTRFNMLRQEKREFFLQNAGLFQFGTGQRTQTNFTLFDSRTIGIHDGQRIPLYGGGKLTGRSGKVSIAALSLQSEAAGLDGGGRLPSTNFSALRLKRDVSGNSHVGLMVLSRQSAASDFSRAFGLDGLWNVSKTIRLDASAAGSFTPGSGGRGTAGDVGFILNREWIDISLRHTHIDSLFNPRMGFVRRPGIRHTDGSVTFTKWINNRHFQNIAFSSGMTVITDTGGILETRDNTFSGSVLSGSGDEYRVQLIRSYEFVPRQTAIRDIRIDPGIYHAWTQAVTVTTYRARPVQASLSAQWGQLFGGTQQSAGLSGTAKASNHLSVDLSYSYHFLDLKNGSLVSHVLSTRWIYSFTPDLFAKAYVQWNSADERFSANLLFDYAYRPRSHIYLVYNENQDTVLRRPRDRMLMLKITRLWQI
ncbi:carbohydrate binding family 9 domain-containing protein [bacterium]|nr:carbohydrate binding family 9 domain-containing protein [bacterium]